MLKSDRSELAAVIARTRRAADLTQVDLAMHCGVSAQYMCDIEAGRRVPPADTRARIAAVLDLSPAALDILAGELPAGLLHAQADIRSYGAAEALADIVEAGVIRMVDDRAARIEAAAREVLASGQARYTHLADDGEGPMLFSLDEQYFGDLVPAAAMIALRAAMEGESTP
jgi:transcriptional regulator with XRE-family HTH domain